MNCPVCHILLLRNARDPEPEPPSAYCPAHCPDNLWRVLDDPFEEAGEGGKEEIE